MVFFKKKKKAEHALVADDASAKGGKGKSQIPEDASLAQKINLIGIELTKINTIFDSIKPDKMMISLQKTDGKIEGVKAALDAKDAMIGNMVQQLKDIKSQMSLFKGVEQVIKLNEEVKDEILNAKRVVAMVERHADKVENIFIESQKSSESFNQFADSLESLKADLKDMGGKLAKLDLKTGIFLVKKDFDDKFSKIEQSDNHMRKLVTKLEKLDKQIEGHFEEAKGELKGRFDHAIAKAEIMSNAFEHILKENPMFAKGHDLEKYVEQHLAGKKEEWKKPAEEKKEESEEKNEVPDELPSLPAEEEKKEEKAESKEEKEEQEEITPDELLPIAKKELSIAEWRGGKKEEAKPRILDGRLYFSKLIKQLNDGVPIEQIGNELNSKDIISSLNENLNSNKEQEDKSVKEGEIKSKISELQQLEREWGSLKIEIDQKKTRFHEIENKIRDYSGAIKALFSEIDELRKQF